MVVGTLIKVIVFRGKNMYIKFEHWDSLAICFFLHEFNVNSKRDSRDALSMAEQWLPKETALKNVVLTGYRCWVFLLKIS